MPPSKSAETLPNMGNEEKMKEIEAISHQFMRHMETTEQYQEMFKTFQKKQDEIHIAITNFQNLKETNTLLKKRVYNYNICIMMVGVGVCVIWFVLYKFFPETTIRMTCNPLQHSASRPAVPESEKGPYVDDIFGTLFPDTTTTSSSQQTTVDSKTLPNPAKMISRCLSWMME